MNGHMKDKVADIGAQTGHVLVSLQLIYQFYYVSDKIPSTAALVNFNVRKLSPKFFFNSS
jgi:hypothetical protein